MDREFGAARIPHAQVVTVVRRVAVLRLLDQLGPEREGGAKLVLSLQINRDRDAPLYDFGIDTKGDREGLLREGIIFVVVEGQPERRQMPGEVRMAAAPVLEGCCRRSERSGLS